MIGFLINLLILVIILGLIYWIITLIPLKPPFQQVAMVVFALICVVVLISLLFGALPFPVSRWR